MDPNVQSVLQALKDLHTPDTVEGGFPDAPPDLMSNPDYNFEVGSIEVVRSSVRTLGGSSVHPRAWASSRIDSSSSRWQVERVDPAL